MEVKALNKIKVLNTFTHSIYNYLLATIDT